MVNGTSQTVQETKHLKCYYVCGRRIFFPIKLSCLLSDSGLFCPLKETAEFLELKLHIELRYYLTKFCWFYLLNTGKCPPAALLASAPALSNPLAMWQPE